MSVLLAHPEIAAQRLDWLADDAVQIEPVSAIKFPSITEKTGNFVNPRGRRPSPRGKIAEVPDG
jgi:hypothetical protein